MQIIFICKVNFVKMNMYISKEVGNETKIQIIKILRVGQSSTYYVPLA